MAGIITTLKIQQRRKDRVNVFLDGEYAFSLQSVIAAGLRRGQMLTDGDIAELQRRDAAEIAYESALHYLSFRPRSEWEVRRHLEQKDVDQETIESVLSRLERAQMTDDQDFAQFWVENREAFRPRGHMGLRAELRQKGIANEIIDQALEGVDEEQNALAAARRAAQRLARLDEQTFRRRLLGFLQRRGFGYDVSRKTVDLLWHEANPGETDPE